MYLIFHYEKKQEDKGYFYYIIVFRNFGKDI